jgi:hypothetical protein
MCKRYFNPRSEAPKTSSSLSGMQVIEDQKTEQVARDDQTAPGQQFRTNSSQHGIIRGQGIVIVSRDAGILLALGVFISVLTTGVNLIADLAQISQIPYPIPLLVGFVLIVVGLILLMLMSK